MGTPLVEAQLIALLAPVFPKHEVRLAPDKITGGSKPLIVIQAANVPIQGLRGRKSIVDVTVFHHSPKQAIRDAERALTEIDNAAREGLLQGVAGLQIVTLPSLATNPTDAASMSVAGFSFTMVGHYMMP